MRLTVPGDFVEADDVVVVLETDKVRRAVCVTSTDLC
jgi:pyruvate/2-oxoglutarate dehydrogenase complex dihydrolipoamide acyltransferase (E2) component